MINPIKSCGRGTLVTFLGVQWSFLLYSLSLRNEHNACLASLDFGGNPYLIEWYYSNPFTNELEEFQMRVGAEADPAYRDAALLLRP